MVADRILTGLMKRGFDVVVEGHAAAILSGDFPTVLAELEAALASTTIPIEEIIAGGGGEHPGTQRLRRALEGAGWPKLTFEIVKTINKQVRESISHEVDHVRTVKLPEGDRRIALEIEWNNKDPFFDRDLENFKRLHAEGAISVGIVVTRGRSLQDNMKAMVARFVTERQIQTFEDLEKWKYLPTAKQRNAIMKRVGRPKNPHTFQEAFVDKFVADKFGEATTHWRKLEDRVHRGVGNPCPLVLIGLPDNIVTFHEGQIALAEVAPDDED